MEMALLERSLDVLRKGGSFNVHMFMFFGNGVFNVHGMFMKFIFFLAGVISMILLIKLDFPGA